MVLYEDAAKKQLQEFIIVLNGCEVIMNACSSFGVILENTSSTLLHRLLTPGKIMISYFNLLIHYLLYVI